MTTKTLEPADDTVTKPQPGDRDYQSEGLLSRVPSDMAATAWRLRRQIGPHAAAAAVVGAGFTAEAVAAQGFMTPTHAALTAAAAACSTGGIVAAVVRKHRRRWGRRVLLGGLAAAAWLTSAPYGVDPENAALLVAAEYALAARWWQTQRIGYPAASVDETASTDAPAPVLAEDGQIIADWADFIACAGGPLPGSQLVSAEETQHGWAFTLLLNRKTQTLTTAIGLLERIAGALYLDIDEIIIESHPLLKGSSRCRFQVITDSPIAGSVVFDGPRRAGDPGYGLLEVGPWADGTGEARWRLYTPGSMWSGVIIGGTGIGKSRVVENIVISALFGGDTEFIYLDPNRGGSSPALAEHAHWFGTADDAGDILEAVLAMLDARGDENAVEGWTGFTPSPERPGILIVVEECHRIFTTQTAEKWARIAREGRKVGVALLCVSQYSGIVTFGGDEALRSSVMEGNAIALRSTSNSNGQLMAGLHVDPKTLPKIPGYAYMQGDELTGARTAPFRNRDTDPTRDGGVALYWLARSPRPGLDVLSATATLAAGTAYRDRDVNDETGRAASRSRVEHLRRGHLLTVVFRGDADLTFASPQTAVGAAAPGVVVFPAFNLGQQPAEAAPTTGGVRQPAAPPPIPTDLSPSHRAVLEAVAAGASRPKEVELATRLSHRRVAELIKDLVTAGHLVRQRYGRYQRAA